MFAFEQQNPKLSIQIHQIKRVGGFVLDGFEKASHLSRMWSQRRCFNTQRIRRLDKKSSKSKYKFNFVDLRQKFDGASLNLIYENGILKQAITEEMEVLEKM